MAQKKKYELSEMMQHFVNIKEKYNDCIIFYRLGDFYELFFEDAILVSKLLCLTLTGKSCGLEEKAPMCGFPHDSGDVYSAKLVEMGYKVAICEQLTEAKPGVRVERDVVKIITPGTITEGSLLDDKKNNYIANIYIENEKQISVVWSDITTGEFKVQNIEQDDALKFLNNTLIRVHPTELICRECDLEKIKEISAIKYKYISNIFKYYDWAYAVETCVHNIKNQFGESGYESIKNHPSGIKCVGSLIEYLNETQKCTLQNINTLKIEELSNVMYMDIATRRNLELTETVRDRKKKGSLLWLMDETKTSMGARLLRNFIENPLIDINEINYRQDATEELFKNIIVRDELSNNLKYISDIERLCCKISNKTINPKEVVTIKNALRQVPEVKQAISKLSAPLFKNAYASLADFEFLINYLNNAINEEPPITIKDGNVIKQGFNNQLDAYRNVSKNAKLWLSDLEEKEKELTGIRNLKIGYNSVFGYYIEVTKSQLSMVPFRYTRRQTLANAERFITAELKDLEEQILNADDNAYKLELEIFSEVKNMLCDNLHLIQECAKNIALVDVITSFAAIATKNNYCKPKITKNSKIEIIDGRHPIVEKIASDAFVSNNTLLDNAENRTMIITGPNMAGKSTYMRQVALITLMAHMGSFVPAEKASISLTDKIFTRIGASDDLAYGQSTFMVEMVEVSNILKNATSNSLILLDEVGRGTATFDGLSIAWAVMEHISKNLTAKTLFSTHYHELSELEGILDGVKNYRITVKEFNNSIIFLRKIARGSANKSFGIAVAKLAGLPQEVIQRAESILKSLEDSDLNRNIKQEEINNSKEFELKSKKAIEICNIIKDINIEKITPFEAMQVLFELSQKLK